MVSTVVRTSGRVIATWFALFSLFALGAPGSAFAQPYPPPPPPPGGPGQPGPTSGSPTGQPSQLPPLPSAKGSPNIQLALESPALNQTVTEKQLRIKGWVADLSAAEGTGIESVHIYIDGSMETGSWLGEASYGQPRDDVVAGFGLDGRFRWVGFDFVWTEVLRAAPGIHTITVAAYSPTNGWAERTQPILIEGKLQLVGYAHVDAAYYVTPGAYAYTTYQSPPSVKGGVGSRYPNAYHSYAAPPIIPVTFSAVVTRNGAPVPGATVVINGRFHMPPTDQNGYTVITVSLPLQQPGSLIGGHMSVEFGGQVADADAYARW